MAGRMRLPNGFGQISRLKQNLRKPYRAMVTVGWSDEGKPDRRIVGYYKTYNDAYQGLLEYHNDPTAFENITILDIWEKWHIRQFEKYPSTEGMYRAAFKRCESIYAKRVSDIRYADVERVINAEMAPSQHLKVKTVLSNLMDYAVIHDYAKKNYARMVKIESEKISDDPAHIAYSEDEIQVMWDNLDFPCVGVILIQCYSGWRPGELIELRTENINLLEDTMLGGIKTEAGRNRTVPIHPRIRPLIEIYYNEENEYLFEKYRTYSDLREKFVVMKNTLGLREEHKPHDGRKTFSTLCKKYHVDSLARKVMMGHHIDDLTDRVYTEIDVDFLSEELRKINM